MCRPRMIALVCMCLSWFMSDGSSARAQVGYTYQGNPFTLIQVPYVAGDRIEGMFQVAIPLQPFLHRENITELITAFSFTDGFQTRDETNTVICNFEVSTDGGGHLTHWSISLREQGVPQGNSQLVLDTSSTSDQGGSGIADMNACDFITLSNFSAFNTSSPGIWTDNLPAQAAAGYNFTSAFFNTVQGGYTTNQRITGFFEVAGPLPPLLEERELGDSLLSFTFSDGIQVRQPFNTQVCQFLISTDAAGHILAWDILLRELPHTQSQPQGSIRLSSFSSKGGTGPGAINPCDPTTLNSFGESDVPGIWTDMQPPGNPFTYEYTGARFTSVSGPYSRSDRIVGLLEFAESLPPYLAERDLAFAVADFQFSDGVQSRQPDQSIICSLKVSTDGNGGIIPWSISLREFPFIQGQPQQILDSSTFQDQGGTLLAGTIACDFSAIFNEGSTTDRGIWRNPFLPAEVAVYDYTGQAYGLVSSPFVDRQRIFGRIAVRGALPANLPLTDIRDQLIFFRFSDGNDDRTSFGSQICRFEVSTDDQGNIVQWTIVLREMVPAGFQQSSIELTNLGLSMQDQGIVGLSGSSLCDNIPVTGSGIAFQAGQWTRYCESRFGLFPQWPDGVTVQDILQLPCPL